MNKKIAIDGDLVIELYELIDGWKRTKNLSDEELLVMIELITTEISPDVKVVVDNFTAVDKGELS